MGKSGMPKELFITKITYENEDEIDFSGYVHAHEIPDDNDYAYVYELRGEVKITRKTEISKIKKLLSRR